MSGAKWVSFTSVCRDVCVSGNSGTPSSGSAVPWTHKQTYKQTWGRLIRQKGGLNTAIKKISVLLKKKRQWFDLLKNCHSFYFIFRIFFNNIVGIICFVCCPIFVFHVKYFVPSARWQLVHFLIATSFLACLSSRRLDLREYWHNCWK